jgi:hypothetical protein
MGIGMCPYFNFHEWMTVEWGHEREELGSAVVISIFVRSFPPYIADSPNVVGQIGCARTYIQTVPD